MEYKIYKSYLAACILSLTTVQGRAADINKEPDRKNVLLIISDDLKPLLGCYGDSLAKTPNIDCLASKGVVFQQAYCQQAISGATRASFLTGLRPDKTQIYDLTTQIRDINPNVVTLPGIFKQQGYVTTSIGKTYHSTTVVKNDGENSWSLPALNQKEYYPKEWGEPELLGYQDPEVKKMMCKYREEAKQKGVNNADIPSYIYARIKPSVECLDIPDYAYPDGALTLKAKEHLTELAKSDTPFFFAVGYLKPHLPFAAPKKYWDLYKRSEMPLAQFTEHAADSPEIAYHSSGELKKYTDILSHCGNKGMGGTRIQLDIEKQKELIHGYYACVSFLDAQIGELMKSLKALGLDKNTIVVLLGDHGWHLGDHDLWNKHSNFEEAVKVPLIVVAPGIEPNVTKSLVEFTDIYPTLCDLAGIELTEKVDGKSLLPILKDRNANIHDFAVSQYPRKLNAKEVKQKGYVSNALMGYSMRMDKFRYTIWMNDFSTEEPFCERKVYAEELYDYSVDPLEMQSRINEKEYKAIKNKFKRKMIDFFESQRLSFTKK